MKCISLRLRGSTGVQIYLHSLGFFYLPLCYYKNSFSLSSKNDCVYARACSRSHPGPGAPRERNEKKMEEKTERVSGCVGCSLKQYLPSTRNPYSLINISWCCNSKEEHSGGTWQQNTAPLKRESIGKVEKRIRHFHFNLF